MLFSKNTIHEAMTSKFYDCLLRFIFWQKDSKIARYFEGGLGQVKEGFRLAIINDQKKGDISKEKNPEVFAYFLTGLFYGLQVMGTDDAIIAKQHSLRNVISNALDDLD